MRNKKNDVYQQFRLILNMLSFFTIKGKIYLRNFSILIKNLYLLGSIQNGIDSKVFANFELSK
ncbi:hypothetical protein DWB61_14605 [Ancylomarina euxinus]|uniref:Uncharacterized protein n=1 Tax=Ancylomarina euxinus TaxID=2283627 RepID=A0A425XXX4_9BACT|nr:hypothetical protein DWB61_14605 [Ancylomarina euxinus]